jgi:hypothetical protein
MNINSRNGRTRRLALDGIPLDSLKLSLENWGKCLRFRPVRGSSPTFGLRGENAEFLPSGNHRIPFRSALTGEINRAKISHEKG